MKKMLAIFLVALLCGCVQEDQVNVPSTWEQQVSPTTTTFPLPEVKVSIMMDQSVYYSNDYMNITGTIDSSEEIEDATLRLYGLYAGYYRIEEEEKMNLSAGFNVKKYLYRAPRCYGCAGILPGTYNISLEVLVNNESYGKNTTGFEMRK